MLSFSVSIELTNDIDLDVSFCVSYLITESNMPLHKCYCIISGNTEDCYK